MKYLLFLGSQTFQPSKNFGSVSVFLNDLFLQQFEVDNQESKTLFYTEPFGINDRDRTTRPGAYDIKWQSYTHDRLNAKVTMEFNVPKKIKMFVLDDSQFADENILHLKINGGPSNYTNGFVTKHNTILIFPIFLLPLDFFKDNNFYQKLFDKNKKIFYMHKKYKQRKDGSIDYKLTYLPWYERIKNTVKNADSNLEMEISNPTYQWPGPNVASNPKSDGKYANLMMANGNDFELQFNIQKKHHIHMLQAFDKKPTGLIQLNMVFMALYDQLKRMADTVSK